MPGPLSGFRVIDLTSMISGPLATMILADQGADVIKVENPAAGGDYVRKGANRRGDFAAAFVNNNRNKRSLALNLKDPRGLEFDGPLVFASRDLMRPLQDFPRLFVATRLRELFSPVHVDRRTQHRAAVLFGQGHGFVQCCAPRLRAASQSKPPGLLE